MLAATQPSRNIPAPIKFKWYETCYAAIISCCAGYSVEPFILLGAITLFLVIVVIVFFSCLFFILFPYLRKSINRNSFQSIFFTLLNIWRQLFTFSFAFNITDHFKFSVKMLYKCKNCWSHANNKKTSEKRNCDFAK